MTGKITENFIHINKVEAEMDDALNLINNTECILQQACGKVPKNIKKQM
jgi:hypothetical protein